MQQRGDRRPVDSKNRMPVDPAIAVSVLNQFAARETLLGGKYARQHIRSDEGSPFNALGYFDRDDQVVAGVRRELL
jgi:hypothetical protein